MSTSRRSGIRGQEKGCNCTGTVTTRRSMNATCQPRSAPVRILRRLMSTGCYALRSGWRPPSRCLIPIKLMGPLAVQGKQIYRNTALDATVHRNRRFAMTRHKPDELVGTVVPIEKIGTDRWRLDSYTWVLAVNQSTLYAGYEKDWGFAPPYPQRFSHFRKQPGYANSPLDGIWLRAPYLHNGSVPTLWELLKPEKERVGFFYRGNDRLRSQERWVHFQYRRAGWPQVLSL